MAMFFQRSCILSSLLLLPGKTCAGHPFIRQFKALPNPVHGLSTVSSVCRHFGKYDPAAVFTWQRRFHPESSAASSGAKASLLLPPSRQGLYVPGISIPGSSGPLFLLLRSIFLFCSQDSPFSPSGREQAGGESAMNVLPFPGICAGTSVHQTIWNIFIEMARLIKEYDKAGLPEHLQKADGGTCQSKEIPAADTDKSVTGRYSSKTRAYSQTGRSPEKERRRGRPPGSKNRPKASLWTIHA